MMDARANPTFTTPPVAIQKYVARIGAEQRGPRKFVVFDEDCGGCYRRHEAEVRIELDGQVRFHVPRGVNAEDFAPTEQEASEIAAVAKSLLRSIAASVWEYENGLLKSDLIVGQVFPVFDLNREDILCVEERIEYDGGKICVRWTLFAAPGGSPRWYMAQPDDDLPFWKPYQFNKDDERKVKSRHLDSVMVHEGPKVVAFIDGLLNDPERREERRRHPWAEELAQYEHWGSLGGASRRVHQRTGDGMKQNTKRNAYVYAIKVDGVVRCIGKGTNGAKRHGAKSAPGRPSIR